MLSGEGNENGEKTTICLIGKKATLHVQHTFFVHFSCRCFARLQRETFRNSLLVLFFSSSCSTKIDSVDLFWLHADFTCVIRTSKKAVSSRDGTTIASRSINTERGSAALVLTLKQEANLPVCL